MSWAFLFQLDFEECLALCLVLAWAAILLFVLPYVAGDNSHWLRRVLANFLPGLTLNLSPPDSHLLSGQDYRLEPPHPAV
jgi:hypothetical protein